MIIYLYVQLPDLASEVGARGTIFVKILSRILYDT